MAFGLEPTVAALSTDNKTDCSAHRRVYACVRGYGKYTLPFSATADMVIGAQRIPHDLSGRTSSINILRAATRRPRACPWLALVFRGGVGPLSEKAHSLHLKIRDVLLCSLGATRRQATQAFLYGRESNLELLILIRESSDHLVRLVDGPDVPVRLLDLLLQLVV